VFIPCGSTTPHKWEPPSFTPGAYYRVYDATFQTMDPWCTREFGDVTSRLASWSRYEQITSCGVCAVTATPTGTTVPTRTPTRTPTPSPTSTSTPGSGTFLELPISYSNFAQAAQGNVGGKGPGRVNSWFDHTYPNYTENQNLTRWDGRIFNFNVSPSSIGESWYDGHNGVDFQRRGTNEQIFAAATGVVLKTVTYCQEGNRACGNYYGNQVWINHRNGYATLYAHLKTVFVSPGTEITNPTSQPLGIMGNTGNSFGTHLHFGVYYDQNEQWIGDDVVDPYGWFGSSADPWNVTSRYLWKYPLSAQTLVGSSGASLTSPSGQVNVLVLAGALPSTVTMELWDAPPVAAPAAQLRSTGRSFWLRVLEQTVIGFSQPVILTATYTPADVLHLDPSRLGVYRWNDASSIWAALPTSVDTSQSRAIAQATETGSFDLQAPLLCPADEREPDDTYDAAGVVLVNGPPVRRVFDIPEDEDWFRLKAVAGGRYVVQTSNLAAGVDTVVQLYNLDGVTLLASDDNSGGGAASRLEWRALLDGTYFLRVYRAPGSAYGCNAAYELNVDGVLHVYLPVLLKNYTYGVVGCLAESPHPYPDNYNNTWTLINPDTNAASTRIHFSRLETENGYDYVYVQDANNNQINRFTGNYSSGVWSDPVPGHTVKVQLTSDGSVTAWGFCVDRIETVSIGGTNTPTPTATATRTPTATPTQTPTSTPSPIQCVTLSLQPPSQSVNGGDTFTFDVTLDAGTTSFDTASLDIRFDPGTLVVVDASGNPSSSIQQGNLNSTGSTIVAQNSVNNTTGTIAYVEAIIGRSQTGGTFTVATIRFRAKQASPGTPVTFANVGNTASPTFTGILLAGSTVAFCAGSPTGATVIVAGPTPTNTSTPTAPPTVTVTPTATATATPTATPTPTVPRYNVWTQCSQGMWGGSISALALSPGYASDRTLFAGTGGAGVFKSTDGGAYWSATGLTNLGVSALALSPGYVTDSTLFAGNWGGGVFKSTDGGVSWSAMNMGLTDLYIEALVISPGYASDRTLFAGTYYGGGVFKSTDGGASWSAVTALTNLRVLALALSPGYASDRSLFVGTYEGGVFKSTDGGASWHAVNTGLPGSYVMALALSPGYATDRTIFVGINQRGVFKSTDGGASWSATGLTYPYLGALALSPGYAADRTIFAGTIYGGGVFKSTDGGASWSAMGLAYAQALALSPGYTNDHTLFAGTEGGVSKSTDGGASWSSVNIGLTNLGVYALALSPGYATDHTLFAGTGDGVYKSTDGGASWSATGLAYAQVLALSPSYASDHTLFAGTGGGVFKSTNSGASWSTVNTGLPTDMYVEALALSPGYATDRTLFAGTGNSTQTGAVFRSTDGGASWSKTGLPSVYVQALALSPGYDSDHTLFAGTRDHGVFKSTTGGAYWSAMGLTTNSIQALTLSPDYASDRTLFAGTWSAGVFKSTDGGASWSAMGLTNLEVQVLELSPGYAADHTLFAGTNGGVFKSTDGGASWSAMNEGLGNLSIQSLTLTPTSPHTLFAGTAGSSVWRYILGQ